jgi:hypothetical protein
MSDNKLMKMEVSNNSNLIHILREGKTTKGRQKTQKTLLKRMRIRLKRMSLAKSQLTRKTETQISLEESLSAAPTYLSKMMKVL